jgi:hypothetical protein
VVGGHKVRRHGGRRPISRPPGAYSYSSSQSTESEIRPIPEYSSVDWVEMAAVISICRPGEVVVHALGHSHVNPLSSG